MGEGGEGQSFEEVAKQFSSRRDETTPNPPFLDEKSVFEEEAPSTAQRRLAFDFNNSLLSLVERQQDRYLYPSPLAIVELHQLHLEAVRSSVPQGEIVPEYTLTHVIGAGERFLAYTYASEQYESEAAFNELEFRQTELEASLLLAAHIEEIGYPLVLQRDAGSIQQAVWEEARGFVAGRYPQFGNSFTFADVDRPYLQLFPEEHPRENVRKLVSGAFMGVKGALRRRYKWTPRPEKPKPFDARAALARATQFGHDDLDHYSLMNVYGASKREVLEVDVQRGWNDNARNTFAAHKLLAQAVTSRPSM